MDLEIIKEVPTDKSAILTVKGRLDAITASELKTQLKHVIGDGHIRLIVDMTGVSFIDSSGLAALVSGHKAVREANGALKLAGLNEQTRTVLALTQLDRVFELYPDVEAALDTLPDT